MPQTQRETRNEEAMQQQEARTVADFAASLSQPLVTPPVVAIPTGATLDLAALDLEGLDLVNGHASEITGATTGDVNLPLLADAPDDWTHTFVVLDGTLNNVNINPAGGDTIMGTNPAVIDADLSSLTVYKRADTDSTDWFALLR
jgi:hypothetical protein